MSELKVTIRGIEPDLWDEVRAIHDHTKIPYGKLLSEALWCWIDDLPEGDDLPITRPIRETA